MNRIKSRIVYIVVFVAILLSLSFIPTRYSRSSYQLVAAANESSDSDSDSSDSDDSGSDSESDSSSDSSEDSEDSSEDEEENNVEVQTPGFIQQHDKTDPCQGIPIPPKIKSSNVEEKCKQRIVKGNHLHLLPRPGQVKAFNQANKLLLQSAVNFNPKAPRVFCNIVVKSCPKTRTAAGYAHYCTGTDDIKIGETADISERQKQNHENLCMVSEGDSSDSDDSTTTSNVGKSICVTFTPPEDWIDNSFVDSDIIDGIKEVLRKLPMTGGIHPDNNEKLINKIIRQVGELNGSCNYNVKEGVVAEWCLRSPSEKEAQLTDYRQIIRDIHPLLNRIRDIFRGNYPLFLMTILTWPKLDDVLREDKYAAISLFLHPRKESISEYLINQCVDEDKRRKFKDAYEECPYLEMITPTIDKIRELMQTNPQPANLKEQLQNLFDDINPEEYQQPKREDLAAGGIERLDEILKDPSMKSILIEVKRDVMDMVKEHKRGWYNDNIFPGKPSSDPCTCTADKLVLPDIKAAKGDDGITEIIPNNNAMELYRTQSCHNIMVTGSEFKMMSPDTDHLIKVNAIRGYLFKTVILLFLNLLDEEGMIRIYKQMLSTLMLTNGLKKTLTVGENDKVGSLWDVMLWILPKYARAETGMLPGQSSIKEAFCYTDQSGTAAFVDNDEMDEFDEGTSNSKRRCLPFRAVLVILHEVGADSFNKILEVMGVSNARVVEKDDKYYLKIDNKVYWAHYDQINGYGHLDTVTEIGWDYINGNYSFDECRDRLLKMNWNKDDNKWVVNEEILEYPLQTTFLIFTVLYTNVDESSDRIRLMKSRFTALQSKLKEGLEEDDEFKQHLTTFSTPERWNELNKFFEHIVTLDTICDDDADDNAYVLKKKHCMPKHDTAVYEYFKNLNKKDSISAKLLRDAMKGTKYAHLVDIGEYKRLCRETEIEKNKEKGGARAAAGRARNDANAAGGGETVYASEEEFSEED